VSGLSTELTADRCATLAALADILVPAVDQWPAASEVGVPDTWATRAISALPGHGSVLAQILDDAKDRDPATEINRLQQEDPSRFNALVLVVVGAYYLSPKVRRLLGWAGPRPNPALDEEADFYLEDGLLDSVISRGPIYRSAP
jgi:hypothetical protein